MLKHLLTLCFMAAFAAGAQWKSYRLVNNDRDTINCIDEKDKKQGRWLIKVESRYGEPGYEEEGIFKNGKKEGIWRCYTSMGDVYAIERYRWGNKDGVNQYYDISGLVREESWKSVNPENPYDTVDVIDPVDPTIVTQKIVLIEGTSVKHGIWKFYDSRSGYLIKSENYFLGKIHDPKAALANNDGAAVPADSTAIKPIEAPKKVKPKEVMDFEKKTGKKKTKVFDGSAGL